MALNEQDFNFASDITMTVVVGRRELQLKVDIPTIHKDTILLQVTQGIRCGEITLDLTSF